MAYTDVEKLASLRVSKKSENTDVRPVDLLRAIVYALETGQETFTGLLVTTREVKTGNMLELGHWRAGITRDDELVMLTLSEAAHINKMRNSR